MKRVFAALLTFMMVQGQVAFAQFPGMDDTPAPQETPSPTPAPAETPTSAEAALSPMATPATETTPESQASPSPATATAPSNVAAAKPAQQAHRDNYVMLTEDDEDYESTIEPLGFLEIMDMDLNIGSMIQRLKVRMWPKISLDQKGILFSSVTPEDYNNLVAYLVLTSSPLHLVQPTLRQRFAFRAVRKAVERRNELLNDMYNLFVAPVMISAIGVNKEQGEILAYLQNEYKKFQKNAAFREQMRIFEQLNTLTTRTQQVMTALEPMIRWIQALSKDDQSKLGKIRLTTLSNLQKAQSIAALLTGSDCADSVFETYQEVRRLLGSVSAAFAPNFSKNQGFDPRNAKVISAISEYLHSPFAVPLRQFEAKSGKSGQWTYFTRWVNQDASGKLQQQFYLSTQFPGNFSFQTEAPNVASYGAYTRQALFGKTSENDLQGRPKGWMVAKQLCEGVRTQTSDHTMTYQLGLISEIYASAYAIDHILKLITDIDPESSYRTAVWNAQQLLLALPSLPFIKNRRLTSAPLIAGPTQQHR